METNSATEHSPVEAWITLPPLPLPTHAPAKLACVSVRVGTSCHTDCIMATPIKTDSGKKKLTHSIKLDITKKKEQDMGNTAIGRAMGFS